MYIGQRVRTVELGEGVVVDEHDDPFHTSSLVLSIRFADIDEIIDMYEDDVEFTQISMSVH